MRESRLQAAAAIFACVVGLGTAYYAQFALGLMPCAFCLLERWPYRIGLAAGVAALVLPDSRRRPALYLVLLAFAAAALLSLTHFGVEQHWWPDPLPECSAPDFSGMTIAQRLAAMPARPFKPCGEPDYLIPGLPLSMAGMAFFYALALCAGLAIWLRRSSSKAAQ